MAKFRCKASGNVVEFTYEVDIKSTRRNKAYEEIIEQENVIEETPTTPKKAGRPNKVVTTAPTEEV